MGLNRYDYFDLTCDGKIDNLVQPECPTRSGGRFTEPEEVNLAAKQAGWTFPGKRVLCPLCSAKSAVEEKPARTARTPKATVPDSQFPGGQ